MNSHRIISELEGFSGNSVNLLQKESGEYVISKRAKKKGSNERMLKQYEKHNFFHSKVNSAFFSTPAILQSGEKDGMFFYEYVYVEGVSLRHFIEVHDIGKIKNVLEKVVSIMRFFSEEQIFPDSYIGGDLKAAVRNKIEKNAAICELDERMVKKMLTKLEYLSVDTEHSLSHGDFTLDNIIIDTQDHIWLIDYDIFFPHYWFDISKFFQDMGGKWHTLVSGETQSNNKMLYIQDYLLNKISTFDERYLQAHNFLMALVFLRLYPYARTEESKSALHKKITDYINLL